MKTFRHPLATETVSFCGVHGGQVVTGKFTGGNSTVTVSDNIEWAIKGALCRVAGRKGVFIVQKVHIAEEDNDWLVEVSVSNVRRWAGRVPLHKLTKHED